MKFRSLIYLISCRGSHQVTPSVKHMPEILTNFFSGPRSRPPIFTKRWAFQARSASRPAALGDASITKRLHCRRCRRTGWTTGCDGSLPEKLQANQTGVRSFPGAARQILGTRSFGIDPEAPRPARFQGRTSQACPVSARCGQNATVMQSLVGSRKSDLRTIIHL